jgi:hypothetical protein
VGASALGVYADGRTAWGVSGPDANGDDFDVDGIAPDVGAAIRAAVAGVRRRWTAYGEALMRLERSTLGQ